MALEFKTSKYPVNYPKAIKYMENRISGIYDGNAEEMLWFLEHPSIYTAGTSASSQDLLSSKGFPVYETGRGGQYTYHGPGQRVVYLMLDLRKREADIRNYVETLENWVIASLKEFEINSERKPGRIGIWTIDKAGRESKIAAIGIRVRKWITYHGISINVNPNLEHYNGIIPCGIREFGVTSLKELGCDISLTKLDEVLKRQFYEFF